MSKKGHYTVALNIATGANTKTEPFTPEAGLIVAACIYTNKADLSTINTGVITAKITDNSGFDIADEVDIRDFRSREGGSYRDSMKPVMLEGGRTYRFTVNATENFTGNFSATLILLYEKDFTTQPCNNN